MADLVKGFLQGSMNKDIDERLLPEGQYRDALNVNVYNQESASTGSVHNSLGNTIIADVSIVSGQPLENAKTIGAVTYEASNLIYWCVASDKFDGVYEYNSTTGDTVRIVQSNKATPTTPSKLNFNKEYSITGINYIPGRNGNNYLYWTDNYNQPRRVNINRAKTYTIDDDRLDIDINVIMYPPLYAPAIYPYIDTDDLDSSNMKEKFITVAYRWKNRDDQYSSLSPFSAVSFAPKEWFYDYGVGNNKSMTNKYNALKIVCESGDEFVKEIQIVIKDTRSPNANVVETISKEQLNILDDKSFTFDFKNNKTYAPLPIDQVTRLFDNVPLLAKAQDIIGNRLSYGNYTQFRDITKCDGNDIMIANTVGFIAENTASESSPKPTWRSDRDYEIGIIYGDDYGRTTTVITSQDNSIYIPPVNAITANKLKLQINNTAPCWATNFRVVVKQSKLNYYTLFPIIFYSNGVYRYILINNSDGDKVKVGDYIIIKTDTGGPTLKNKRYKVLEITSKGTNFIGTNSITEIAGTYLKIKVDQQSELDPGDVTTYNHTSKGTSMNSQNPVDNRFPVTENAIHYGSGNPMALIVSNGNEFNGSGTTDKDWRFTFEIVSQTEFRYTADLTAGTSWIYRPITAGDIWIDAYNVNLFTIQIDQSQPLEVGDRWKVCCRSGSHLTGNYFGGVGLPGMFQQLSDGSYLPSFMSYTLGEYGGGCIPTGAEWFNGTGVNATDRPIYTGAVITINIIIDSKNAAQQAGPQEFISNGYYVNIEEWFLESGAWQLFEQPDMSGQDIVSEGVTFRRGFGYTTGEYANGGQSSVPYSSISQGQDISPNTLKYPVHMIIQGFGIGGNASNRQRVECNIDIQQLENNITLETVPIDTNNDIYHEVFQTYEIVDGDHIVMWNFDDYQFENGNTKLAQLTKGKPHYFAVGESVYVESFNAPMPAGGTWNIIAVPDQHSIVIDLGFPGIGLSAGRVKYAGSLEQDQSGNTPAIIEINKPQSINSEFNAWCWGNGIESDRILDDFNETTKGFSVRAYTTFEGYKQVTNEASICYSGIYSENSSLNRINEFNLSLANFKHLEKEFGSIQKLDARDTDLLVYQENKISQVLYGKNILYDSAGGGQVASIPEVLGTQIAFPGEYGISKNPESFDKYGQDRWFTDTRRGMVLQLTGDNITEISRSGMSDFFRDLMNNNSTTEKIGAFDPHNKMYVLSSTNNEALPCLLSISRNEFKVPKNAASYVAFSITANCFWTVSLVDIGSGTYWITGFTSSGFGSQDIHIQVAQNLMLINRSVKFVVTFCGGQTREFILSQAKGRKGTVVVGVINSNTEPTTKL
jgi:hypothetical protein